MKDAERSAELNELIRIIEQERSTRPRDSIEFEGPTEIEMFVEKAHAYVSGARKLLGAIRSQPSDFSENERHALTYVLCAAEVRLEVALDSLR